MERTSLAYLLILVLAAAGALAWTYLHLNRPERLHRRRRERELAEHDVALAHKDALGHAEAGLPQRPQQDH